MTSSPVDHLPRAQLESLAAGGLPELHLARAEQHVRKCQSCQARLHGIQRAQRRYESVKPADDFARAVMLRAAAAAPKTQSLAPWRWLRGARWGLVTAIAAAALLLFIGRHDGDAIHFKGDAPITWRVFAKHGETSRQLNEGESLQAGDKLAFTYAVHAAGFVNVLGIDDDGQVTAYGPSSFKVSAGEGRLPFGIELDSRHGSERLFAFLSAAPLDQAVLRADLAAAWARARAESRPLQEMTVVFSGGVQTRTFWFRKD